MNAEGRDGSGLKIWSGGWSQSDTAKLEPSMFEIEDEADLKACGSEIVEHATDLMLGDAFDGFSIDDDLPKHNQVGNVFTHLGVPIDNRESFLLTKRNVMEQEVYDQGFFIRLFMITVAKRVEHSERATDDPLSFHHMNPFSSICVHPVHLWLNFFKRATVRPAASAGR
jgi:hypothetical protein